MGMLLGLAHELRYACTMSGARATGISCLCFSLHAASCTLNACSSCRLPSNNCCNQLTHFLTPVVLQPAGRRQRAGRSRGRSGGLCPAQPSHIPGQRHRVSVRHSAAQASAQACRNRSLAFERPPCIQQPTQLYQAVPTASLCQQPLCTNSFSASQARHSCLRQALASVQPTRHPVSWSPLPAHLPACLPTCLPALCVLVCASLITDDTDWLQT